MGIEQGLSMTFAERIVLKIVGESWGHYRHELAAFRWFSCAAATGINRWKPFTC
jgi:hypothetical protein